LSRLVYKFSNTHASSVRTVMIARSPCDTVSDTDADITVHPLHHQHSADTSDTLACGNTVDSHCYDEKRQLLIFTKGSQTYTPHQIGIKRMPHSVSQLLAQQLAHADNGGDDDNGHDDDVDVTVDFHGHIIGMNLSPDHRLNHMTKIVQNLYSLYTVKGSMVPISFFPVFYN